MQVTDTSLTQARRGTRCPGVTSQGTECWSWLCQCLEQHHGLQVLIRLQGAGKWRGARTPRGHRGTRTKARRHCSHHSRERALGLE